MLTIDLDSTNEKRVEEKAILMKKMFPDKSVMYRISANKKGGHVKVMDISLSEEEEINLRALMGDDDRRIAKDVERRMIGLPRQILFNKKINLKTGTIKEAGEWRTV